MECWSMGKLCTVLISFSYAGVVCALPWVSVPNSSLMVNAWITWIAGCSFFRYAQSMLGPSEQYVTLMSLILSAWALSIGKNEFGFPVVFISQQQEWTKTLSIYRQWTIIDIVNCTELIVDGHSLFSPCSNSTTSIIYLLLNYLIHTSLRSQTKDK